MRASAAVVASMLVLGIAGAAEAAPISYREWVNICGPGDLGNYACGSIKLQVDNETFDVTLSVQNLSGLFDSYENFVFTQITFFNAAAPQLPDAVEGTVSSMTGPVRTSNGTNPPPAWTVNNEDGAGGVLSLDFFAGVNGNDGGIASSCATSLPGGANDLWMSPACGNTAVTNPLLNDGWVVMTWKMSGPWDLDLTDTQFQVHAQSNIGSVKCTSATDCLPWQTAPLPPIPEPATMTLFGLGLAGVAAARRRGAKR